MPSRSATVTRGPDGFELPKEAGELWLPASFFGIAAVQVAVLEGAGDPAVLTHDERQRLAAFRSTRRRAEFVRGRTVLRRAVGEVLGDGHASVVRDEAGALRLEGHDAALSLTHTADLSAVALGPQQQALGLDVEHVRPVHSALLTRMLGEGEIAPDVPHPELVVWTAKEAVLKATGQGLRTRMAAVRIDWEAGGEAPLFLGRCVDLPVPLRVVVRAANGRVWALAVGETDA